MRNVDFGVSFDSLPATWFRISSVRRKVPTAKIFNMQLIYMKLTDT